MLPDGPDSLNINAVIQVHIVLFQEEEQVDLELKGLLGQQAQLESQLRSLSGARPQLDVVKKDASKLASVIEFTARLAEGVSVKVKQLDLAKVK